VQQSDPVCAAKWSDKQHVPIISAYCTPPSDGHKKGKQKHIPVCVKTYTVVVVVIRKIRKE